MAFYRYGHEEMKACANAMCDLLEYNSTTHILSNEDICSIMTLDGLRNPNAIVECTSFDELKILQRFKFMEMIPESMDKVIKRMYSKMEGLIFKFVYARLSFTNGLYCEIAHIRYLKHNTDRIQPTRLWDKNERLYWNILCKLFMEMPHHKDLIISILRGERTSEDDIEGHEAKMIHRDLMECCQLRQDIDDRLRGLKSHEVIVIDD